MAISVSGFDKDGIDRVYGRSVRDGKEVPQDQAEQVAEENARAYAAAYIKDHPETGPIESWTFEVDPCDRQIFEPSK
jgi:hypothetical protein